MQETFGMFAGDPQYEEIVRLGREHRRQANSVVVPITTLEPEPFDLARDIPVVVQPTDDGFWQHSSTPTSA